MMKVTTRKNASKINLTKMEFILMKCKYLHYNDKCSAIRLLIKVNEI
jgi:hypothetical protein